MVNKDDKLQKSASKDHISGYITAPEFKKKSQLEFTDRADIKVNRRQQRPAQQALTDHVTARKPELWLTVTQTHTVGHVCQCTMGFFA